MVETVSDFKRTYIYKITNTVNGKIYIGQFRGKDYKWKNYFGGGYAIKDAIKKYKRKNFTKEIIFEGIINQALTDSLEKHYIQLYAANVHGVGYNLTSGGIGYTAAYKSESCPFKKFYLTKQDETIVLESAAEVMKKFGCSEGYIHHCIRNKRLLSGYFVSREPIDELPDIKPMRYKIEVYVTKNGVSQLYTSLREAAKACNVSNSVLTNNLKTKSEFWANDFLVSKSLPIEFPEKIKKSGKTIKITNTITNEIKIFKAYSFASAFLGIVSREGVSKICKRAKLNPDKLYKNKFCIECQ